MGGRSGRFVLACSVIIRFQVECPGGLQSCSIWYILPGMPLFSFLYSSSDMVQLDSNLNYEFLSNNSDFPYTYFRLQFFLEYAYIIFLIYLKNLTLSKGIWCSSDETAHTAHKQYWNMFLELGFSKDPCSEESYPLWFVIWQVDFLRWLVNHTMTINGQANLRRTTISMWKYNMNGLCNSII